MTLFTHVKKKLPDVEPQKILFWIDKLFGKRIYRVLYHVKVPKQLIDLNRSRGVYVYGPPGTGKTIYACTFLLMWIEKYINFHTAGFVSVPNLLFEFKKSYEWNSETTESVIFEKYERYRILVLDDFGVEKSNDWSQQILYKLINARYEADKITVYTSNLSLQEVTERTGDARISSRIHETCDIVHKDGKDLRN